MSLITLEITRSSLWGSSFWDQKTVNCLDKTMRKPLNYQYKCKRNTIIFLSAWIFSSIMCYFVLEYVLKLAPKDYIIIQHNLVMYKHMINTLVTYGSPRTIFIKTNFITVWSFQNLLKQSATPTVEKSKMRGKCHFKPQKQSWTFAFCACPNFKSWLCNIKNRRLLSGWLVLWSFEQFWFVLAGQQSDVSPTSFKMHFWQNLQEWNMGK